MKKLVKYSLIILILLILINDKCFAKQASDEPKVGEVTIEVRTITEEEAEKYEDVKTIKIVDIEKEKDSFFVRYRLWVIVTIIVVNVILFIVILLIRKRRKKLRRW